MASESRLYVNARLAVPGKITDRGALLVSGGKFAQVYEDESWHAEQAAGTPVEDVAGSWIVPGFVDVHIHGGGGFDVMSGNPADVEAVARYHAERGTTSLLATTRTESQAVIERAIAGIVQAMRREGNGADIAGIHLEGPFLNVKRCGAQNPQNIRRGTVQEFDLYYELSEGNLRLFTCAPEFDGMPELIRHAAGRGVTVSIGHSDASYGDVVRAIEAGASHVTHTFNGMSPFHHRDPGVAGAALMLDALAVELICDGLHVCPEAVRFVYRTKPPQQIIAVTDCVLPAGCPDGDYSSGRLPTMKRGNTIQVKLDSGEPGSLAGSTLDMNAALRNIMAFTGLPLEQVLPSLTINPARQAKIDDRKGSVEAGKDADFLILSRDLLVTDTFVRGRRVFSRAQPAQSNRGE